MGSVDVIIRVFGKDIASIIYRCLFQINMHDVNAQYRKFLNTDAQFIRFAATTTPSKFVAILFNYRYSQGVWSNIPISHHVYTNNGWMWNESNIALPKNYW